MTKIKAMNNNGWIQTLTGARFYPANPQLNDIHIRDIAGALARQCRFGGHCPRFYSVAEHCVLLARHVEKTTLNLALTALLHDASEAYLVDIPRPIKSYLGGYSEMEDRVMRTISLKYRVVWPLPQIIKNDDLAILSDEREQNMAPIDASPEEWGNILPALGIKLQFWDSVRAEKEFLEYFYYLTSMGDSGR